LLKTSEIIELKIFNSAGILVYNNNVKKETATVVSFQSYPQGMYFVELLHNNGHINTIKIIKKQ
jgi:Secretion system C-terminal sorting domain